MAFDPDLIDRIEAALRQAGGDPVRRRMFGGIAFMIGGNMAIASSGTHMHARVGPENWTAALAHPEARAANMTGRDMTGWVTIDEAADLDESALAGWAETVVGFVSTLPAK